MTWAGRRRAFILGWIGLAILIILALVLFLALHKAPSCVDGIQNQGEAGIDCGGPCPYLCTEQEQAPVVRFTQFFPGVGSSTDAIAYIDNPNQTAYAKGVSYTLALYDNQGIISSQPSGTIDLAPGATTPVFIANIATGSSVVARAFLAIATSTISWQVASSPVPMPSVGSPSFTSGTAPRVTVMLSDAAAKPLANVVVIATLFDADGNVITASQTLLPTIPAQGSAQATFNWNTPLPTPARIEVLPEPVLP